MKPNRAQADPRKPGTLIRKPIYLSDLPPFPLVTDELLRWHIFDLDRKLRGVGDRFDWLSEKRKQSADSVWAQLAKLLGPNLLAIAFALRITKVTGELKLELQSSRSSD